MYVIVTNHVNWHRENLQSDRENTGNSKTQFEWVPWGGLGGGGVSNTCFRGCGSPKLTGLSFHEAIIRNNSVPGRPPG